MRGCACRGTAGFAHVSCLAEQAKILVADAEERNLDDDKWSRWHTCGTCEQEYRGVTRCALGWACWKTYLGRTEENWCRSLAMNQLGNGLDQAGHHEDAVSVREAELSVLRRFGAPEKNVLVAQSNLAGSYSKLGRFEDASRIQRDVYSGTLNLLGAEHLNSLGGANNYAMSLVTLERYEEAKSLLRRTVPVARRVLGEGHELTLTMRSLYAQSLYVDPSATLDDLRKAVTTLEDVTRITLRVLGAAHPLTENIERGLRDARAALREATPPPS